MASLTAGVDGEHQAKMKIFAKIAGAAVDDIAEVPPDIASFYLSQLALVVEWCSTGQWKSANIPMPEGFDGEF